MQKFKKFYQRKDSKTNIQSLEDFKVRCSWISIVHFGEGQGHGST